MRRKFLLIPTLFIFQISVAQDGAVSVTPAQVTPTPGAAASSTPVTPPVPPSPPAPAPNPDPAGGQIAIIDYKSVYDAETVEEEVKMAAERYNLTTVQQDIWLKAATDRRIAEKQARADLDSSRIGQVSKHGVYMGLRTSHNTFHETINGYLTPAQKQQIETDRLIIQEKQKRLAKLPPPPPPKVDTVIPVDSTAIKEAAKESAKEKKAGKKPKKKKKSAG